MFIEAFLTTLLYQNQLIMTKTDYTSYFSKKLKKTSYFSKKLKKTRTVTRTEKEILFLKDLKLNFLQSNP